MSESLEISLIQIADELALSNKIAWFVATGSEDENLRREINVSLLRQMG